MNLGFRFRETMSGTFYRLDSPHDERPMSFTIEAKVKSLRAFARDKLARIQGTVTMDGFARARPLEGTLAMRMLDQRRLPYEFTFTGDDCKIYRFRGQKDISVLAPVESMTVLPASVFEPDGKEVARATVRFDLRGDIKKFVRSFRLTI
jgi:hypothetical protein